MRVQLMSDLHLERYPAFEAQAAADADLLVLAGDIGSYQARSLLGGDDFGLERFSPLRPASPWKKVLYLPGNHEFDALPYEETYVRLRRLCERLGLLWLEGEVLVIGSVRFIGSTLWSDFDALARRETRSIRQLQQREKAFRAANFYLQKNTTLRHGQPALAAEIRAMALASQAWLDRALQVPFAGTTVVVTHFAPSLRSADPRYGLTPGTAGFCNALDEWFARADVWMHGHLHCANDYVVRGVDEGRDYRCRVVANPRGYASKGEQLGFRENFVIDVTAP